MTKNEFYSQMAKVAANPEAKKAMEEAASVNDMIQAAALAGVVISEEDLREVAAAGKNVSEELSDGELDAVTAAGVKEVVNWITEKILNKIMDPFYKLF